MDILINEPDGFPQDCLTALARCGRVYLATGPYPAERIGAVFIRLRDRIGPEFHRRHPALKFVISPTTGLGHIDTAYFEKSDIKILSLKGQRVFLDNIHATAEHTLALALSLSRKIPEAVASVRTGHWNRYPFQGSELFGKTVLIIGYGRIGRQVAQLYSAFGARLLITDVVPDKVSVTQYVTLANGLAAADIVSIHVDLNENSAGVLDAVSLAKIKKGALLINTSRGEVLDQNALLDLLHSGQIGGAALDVVVGEPAPQLQMIQDAMERLKGRLIVTPHIGGFTSESLQLVENFVTDMFLKEKEKIGVK